jgi:hypothetical protein
MHKTDHTRCDAWVQRLKYWIENGLQEIYFFLHMQDDATTPAFAINLVDKLNKGCNLNLIKPRFIDA